MGRIEIHHFDRAVIEHMEPVLIKVGVGDQQREEYALEIDRVRGVESYQNLIPVFFSGGEQGIGQMVYPHVVVDRTGDDSDDPRLIGDGMQAITPMPHSAVDEITMPDGTVRFGAKFLKLQLLSYPRVFSYQISILCRGDRARAEAHQIWVYLMRRFELRGFSLHVLDDADEDRTYDGEVEDVPMEIQYPDASVREIKRSITIKIHGEYDILEEVIVRTASSPPERTVGRM